MSWRFSELMFLHALVLVPLIYFQYKYYDKNKHIDRSTIVNLIAVIILLFFSGRSYIWIGFIPVFLLVYTKSNDLSYIRWLPYLYFSPLIVMLLAAIYRSSLFPEYEIYRLTYIISTMIPGLLIFLFNVLNKKHLEFSIFLFAFSVVLILENPNYSIMVVLVYLLFSIINRLFKETLEVEKIRESENSLYLSLKMLGHDFGNYLTQMYTPAQMLMENNIKDKKSVELIVNNCRRAIDLVNKVQEYGSKEIKLDLEKFNVLLLLDEMLENCFSDSVVNREIQSLANNTDITADKVRLEQAFSNILVNAKQSMPDGGNLNIFVAKQGKFIKVNVQDTGVGIPREDHIRIFKPFFTSKSRKENSGLGLFTVKRIIEIHCGKIEVRSEVGKGTEFIVYLPYDLTEKELLKSNGRKN